MSRPCAFLGLLNNHRPGQGVRFLAGAARLREGVAAGGKRCQFVPILPAINPVSAVLSAPGYPASMPLRPATEAAEGLWMGCPFRTRRLAPNKVFKGHLAENTGFVPVVAHTAGLRSALFTAPRSGYGLLGTSKAMRMEIQGARVALYKPSKSFAESQYVFHVFMLGHSPASPATPYPPPARNWPPGSAAYTPHAGIGG